MNKAIVFSFVLIVATVAGCGGGGGGGGNSQPPALVVSTATFDLASATNSKVTGGFKVNFDATVTVPQGTATGSGSLIIQPAVAATFEGQPALSLVETLSMTLTSNGGSKSITKTATSFLDTNNNSLGFVEPSEYSVVTTSRPDPRTAKVGDKWDSDTGTIYSDSTKGLLIGMETSRVEIEADTADSAIIRSIGSRFDASGALLSTSDVRYRIDTKANLTLVSSNTVYTDGTRVRLIGK